MTKSTGMHRKDDNDRSEPWRSWPSTVRYMVVKLAQAAPNGVLVWLAYVHR
jgi:hypothetical protein